MSRRRNVGEWVWLKPNSGFVGNSHILRAIIFNGEPEPCMICNDPECQEWPTLLTERDERGAKHMLCHVSECQMLDEPYKDTQNETIPI